MPKRAPRLIFTEDEQTAPKVAKAAQKASKAFVRTLSPTYPERLKLPPVDSLPNKCRDKIGTANSSPALPIPLHRLCTRDESYPQAVN